MKTLKSVAITITLITVSFVAGFVLATWAVQRHTFRLYVSVPGEYTLDFPGGNWLLARKTGFLNTGDWGTKCVYSDDPLTYDAIITRDVLKGQSTVVPNCYASIVPDYRKDTRFTELPGWK